MRLPTPAKRTRLAAAITPLILAATLALGTTSQVPQEKKPEPLPAWTPPPDRAKEWTPFAPRPIGGDNIFKGEAERWLADLVSESEEAEAYGDREVGEYVTRLGRALVAYSAAPKKAYEFVVTGDDEPNAWTAGGGRVYVHVGMLRSVESEDELAGVVAHELAHDAFAHSGKTLTRQLFWMTGVRKVRSAVEVSAALERLSEEYEKNRAAAFGERLLGFARFDELEADRAAFYNLYRAGYNPRALAAVLRRMERGAKAEMGRGEYARAQLNTILFGTHPPTDQRATAFSWESNFLKMPPTESRRASPAFDALKARLAKTR